MKKKILLTRPEESSQHWAQLLSMRGYDCVINPLLRIEPTNAPRPTQNFHAIVITSANALRVLDNACFAAWISMPCFCVGETTGDIARTAGFTDVRCGSSDSVELAHLITTTLTGTPLSLLHICGEINDNKAHDLLTTAGFVVTTWAVYHALATEDLSPETRTLFASGDIAFIPVFSPRSARLLIALIEKNGLTEACSGITTVALSQAVADVLQILPWRHLRIAATPSEESVIACLEKSYV